MIAASCFDCGQSPPVLPMPGYRAGRRVTLCWGCFEGGRRRPALRECPECGSAVADASACGPCVESMARAAAG